MMDIRQDERDTDNLSDWLYALRADIKRRRRNDMLRGCLFGIVGTAAMLVLWLWAMGLLQ